MVLKEENNLHIKQIFEEKKMLNPGEKTKESLVVVNKMKSYYGDVTHSALN
jgi:hypothetical protein